MDTNVNSTIHSAANPVIAEYEARRCHVCQRKYPSFGFDHSSAKKRPTIWACLEHRAAVDQMLTGDPTRHEQSQSSRLL